MHGTNNVKDEFVCCVHVVCNKLSFHLYLSITMHPILKGRHVNIMLQNGLREKDWETC